MRVLVWSEGYWPRIGGVEVLASRLFEALGARGHEIGVVTVSHEGLPDDSIRDGVRVHRLPLDDTLLDPSLERLAALRRRLQDIRRELAPQLFHVFHHGPGLFVQLSTQRGPRLPMLMNVHSQVSTMALDDRSLLGRALRAADQVCAVSAWQLDELRAALPEIAERSRLIHNAVPEPTAEATDPPLDPPRLLFLGRLAREKGCDLAIAALAAVAARFPDLRLIVGGSGPESEALRRQARALGIEDRVQLRGWVGPVEVARLIDAATLVLMPSRNEGLPLVALETAWRGRPLLASRVGGLPEIVEDGTTGLLLPVEDPAAIADAIGSLLAEPERVKRMGRAARNSVAERFAWSSCVENYEQMYEDVLEGSDHGRAA